MSRAIAPAVAIALAIAFVGASTAHGAAPTISATVEPAEPHFGDSFAYLVAAVVPEDAAESVRVVNDIAPFTRVGPTRVSRSAGNGVTRITVTETIACLAAQCLPGADGKVVTLPPARVTGAGAVAVAAPALVRVRPRVPTAAAAASKPVFLRPVELPPATWRFEVRIAEAALTVVGILLLATGLLTLAVPLRRRGRPEARRVSDRDAVARAARLLRESTTRDSTDRRRAAGLAARIAREPELAGDAAHVAWSRPEPGSLDAETLADRIERASEPTRAGRA